MKANDFDGIANWYDRLAKLIFGDNIKKAQCHFLNELPIKGHVLIIGGGSGWILEEIFRIRPELKVDYVEAASKMIALSEERIPITSKVRFIHGTEVDIPAISYDCIITNFFLDVFEEERLLEVMYLLKTKLKQEGIWLCTDFQITDNWVHNLLLKAMHVFFALVSNLDAKTLLDFEGEFNKMNFCKANGQNFYSGMIHAAVYKSN
jgi:ubiquinone/menaquinone biosynthesis C-methylase UbiE